MHCDLVHDTQWYIALVLPTMPIWFPSIKYSLAYKSTGCGSYSTHTHTHVTNCMMKRGGILYLADKGEGPSTFLH